MRSISKIPDGARLFCGRCTVVPFEIATAVTAIWTGLASFFELTIAASVVSTTLPHDLVIMFNLIYILSGAFILAGVGWNYRNLEATGVIFLFTSLLVRLVVLLVIVGLQPPVLTALIQNLTFGAAAALRLVFLLKHRALAVVEVPADNGD